MLSPPHPFFMIRHGETDWNKAARFQGQVDIPLNALGQKQAAGNGKALGELIDAKDWKFLCSPMSRTRQTMELVRENMDIDATAYETDERLIEVTFGEWERKTVDEVSDEYPDLFAERNADKWNFVPPGGESYAQGAERVRPVLEQLTGPTVIVTHGGIIRGTRVMIEGIDPDATAHSAIPQDRLYFFDGEEGGWLGDEPNGEGQV